jgi:hypothetical protein
MRVVVVVVMVKVLVSLHDVIGASVVLTVSVTVIVGRGFPRISAIFSGVGIQMG